MQDLPKPFIYIWFGLGAIGAIWQFKNDPIRRMLQEVPPSSPPVVTTSVSVPSKGNFSSPVPQVSVTYSPPQRSISYQQNYSRVQVAPLPSSPIPYQSPPAPNPYHIYQFASGGYFAQWGTYISNQILTRHLQYLNIYRPYYRPGEYEVHWFNVHSGFSLVYECLSPSPYILNPNNIWALPPLGVAPADLSYSLAKNNLVHSDMRPYMVEGLFAPGLVGR